jgi:hypothetical protein
MVQMVLFSVVVKNKKNKKIDGFFQNKIVIVIIKYNIVFEIYLYISNQNTLQYFWYKIIFSF